MPFMAYISDSVLLSLPYSPDGGAAYTSEIKMHPLYQHIGADQYALASQELITAASSPLFP
jgi:hypothetical protein